MTPLVANVNNFLGLLTLLSNIAILAVLSFFIVLYFTGGKKRLRQSTLFQILGSNAFILALVVSLTATLGSLFYSEVAGFEPCKLCWYQRILMYPQVVLLGLAIKKRDRNIADYLLALSLLGAPIALYHYFLQRVESPFVPCTVVGYSASCNQSFTMQFGYITIPMMTLTAFILIMLLITTGKLYIESGKSKKRK